MNPLTDEERARMNSVNTPESERALLYARMLRATAYAYATAADAPGLRKDAARYLYAESRRLDNEAGFAFDRAYDLEAEGK